MTLPEHELIARIHRTLGHPTRLRILECLERLGEVTQSELVDVLGTAQPRVSEHLSCLAWCGLVLARREGRTARYRLADDFAPAFLALARRFLRENEGSVGTCSRLEAPGDRNPRIKTTLGQV